MRSHYFYEFVKNGFYKNNSGNNENIIIN